MIEDPYLANDFELFLINYKSKTNKFILPYDMYSECTIMNIISHHLLQRHSCLTSRKIQQFQANRDRLLRPSRTAGAQDEGKNCLKSAKNDIFKIDLKNYKMR